MKTAPSATVQKLISLASNESASPLVRAEANGVLRSLNVMLKTTAVADAHRRTVQEEIERSLNRLDAVRQPNRPVPTPSGDPVGNAGRSN